MSAEFRVGVQSGEGVVARVGSAIIVADARTGLETFTNVVLAELDNPTLAPTDIAWRLAELLVQNRASAPSFGAVIVHHTGFQLLLHGAVRAIVNDQTEIHGTTAMTWVDQPITEPVVHIACSLSPAGAVDADPRTDLRGGLVPGDGFRITTAAAQPLTPDAPTPPTIAPAAPPEPQPGPQPVLAPTAAIPTVEATVEPTVEPTSEPTAEQFKPPTRETVAIADALTALFADDGTKTPLDRAYVFGREPQQDAAVQNGYASPIRLDDPEHLISRVQAYLYVDEHGVTVKDAGSANGTFLAAPGAPDWTRLADDIVPLPVGWSIRMGRRVFTHFAVGA